MRKRTVLVVDDEAPVRRLLRDTLVDAGYEVLEAEDGREAMDRLKSSSVDVLISDLVMPEREGLETIAEVRRQYPSMRVVSMSGAFGGQFLGISKLMGADAALSKPIDVQELLQAVLEW